MIAIDWHRLPLIGAQTQEGAMEEPDAGIMLDVHYLRCDPMNPTYANCPPLGQSRYIAMFAYVRTFEDLGAHPNAAPKVSIIANSKADKVHDIDPLGKCALPKGPGQPDINMKDLMRPGPRQDDFFQDNCPVNARQGDDQGHRR